jgi:hypothetical protein
MCCPSCLLQEGLLLWVKRQTAPYGDAVPIQDFHKSWRNGMGFCALMHRYRSDEVDFASLDPKNGMANMELALSVAESCFGIDRLFDPEDVVDMEKPDEKIVITYVAMIFRALARFIKSEALVKSIKKVRGWWAGRLCGVFPRGRGGGGKERDKK